MKKELDESIDNEINDETAKKELRKDMFQNLKVFFIALVIFGLISFFIKYVYSPVIVNGNSMNPTLCNGDIFTCDKDFTKQDIHRGDIVVFSNKNTSQRKLIKRVIGMPGESINILDGQVYINGEKLEEYIFEDMIEVGTLSYPITLNDDEYFCLGDNRNHSSDSRVYGAVKYEDIQYIVQDKLFTLD